MYKITLKDNSQIEFNEAKTVMEIAQGISEGLARVALCAKVNGEVCDLSYVIDKDATLEILTFDAQEGKNALRHSASHILAQAVKRLYPDAKLAIGPAIENGFYYDFDCETSFTPEVLHGQQEQSGQPPGCSYRPGPARLRSYCDGWSVRRWGKPHGTGRS